MKQYNAKIDIYFCNNLIASENFCGTSDKIYTEAFDFMNAKAVDYIVDHDASNLNVENSITHEITFNPLEPIFMYAVFCNNELVSVQSSRAEAEEMIMADCEAWVYQFMMTVDPQTAMGKNEWNWAKDYAYLMRDSARGSYIEEVPVFGVYKEDFLC